MLKIMMITYLINYKFKQNNKNQKNNNILKIRNKIF